MRTKREQILEMLKEEIPIRVAEHFGVNSSYIYNVIREEEVKAELSRLKVLVEEQKRIITNLSTEIKYFHDLAQRGALEAYPDKMSEGEIKKWQDL